MAAAGQIETTVTPLSANVTYSTTTGRAPATFYVGYTVTLKNISGNTINNVYFEGATTVTDGQEVAAFNSADGMTCSVETPTTPGNSVTVLCPLGQFKAGDVKGPFAVFFTSPVKDTVSPTADGSDFVSFSGNAVTAEGYNGGGSPNNSRDPWTALDVVLGTSSPVKIKSAIPKSGGTFFTGDDAVTLPTDKIATKVTVPPLTTYTTAVIEETTLQADCATSPNFLSCFSSELTIPGSFAPYLTIIIRQDASNIRKGVSINSVIISYQYKDAFGNPQTYSPVGPCASPTTPLAGGLPCIADRQVYRKNYKPDTDLSGDFEWTIINTKNGRFDIQ